MKKVLLGMSGGLDSTFAVQKLREMGYSVEGAVLKMHAYTEIEEAKASADALGVPLRVINAEVLFSRTVIRDFCEAYRCGKTPNPCVLCNEAVKLRLLYEEALSSSFDYIATGHYARIARIGERYAVMAGIDAGKDQSYMLYRLPQDILSRLLLPLGELCKTDVKREARAEGIAAAERPESQEICFVREEGYAEYIDRVCGALPCGDFVDEKGNVLGRHKGIHHYTVGQRKGLGVSAASRLFVQSICPETNRIVLSATPKRCNMFRITSPVFSGISEDKLGEGECFEVMVRYLAKKQKARLFHTDDGALLVKIEGGEVSTTPGQSAVFYRDDAVMLGGVIELF